LGTVGQLSTLSGTPSPSVSTVPPVTFTMIVLDTCCVPLEHVAVIGLTPIGRICVVKLPASGMVYHPAGMRLSNHCAAVLLLQIHVGVMYWPTVTVMEDGPAVHGLLYPMPTQAKPSDGEVPPPPQLVPHPPLPELVTVMVAVASTKYPAVSWQELVTPIVVATWPTLKLNWPVGPGPVEPLAMFVEVPQLQPWIDPNDELAV
jgi:hypothetical protein